MEELSVIHSDCASMASKENSNIIVSIGNPATSKIGAIIDDYSKNSNHGLEKPEKLYSTTIIQDIMNLKKY